MSRNITKDQLKCVHTLFSIQKIAGQQKKDIIAAFVGSGDGSSKSLSYNQAAGLISYLKEVIPAEAKAEKLRASILSLAHEMGWESTPGKVDIDRVNAWCNLQFGEKPLNKYTGEELPKLLWIFKDKVYSQFIKSL